MTCKHARTIPLRNSRGFRDGRLRCDDCGEDIRFISALTQELTGLDNPVVMPYDPSYERAATTPMASPSAIYRG